MRSRLKLNLAAGALVFFTAGTANAQLAPGNGAIGSGPGLQAVDTSALASTLLRTGSDGVAGATAGTPLASLGTATADTLSGVAPLATLPLAYADFLLFDGPVPLPRVLPDSPLDLLAPLTDELSGAQGFVLPGLEELPRVDIVPRLDPLPVPIPQIGRAMDG